MAKEYIEREAALFAALVGADKWDGGSNYERDLVIEEAISRVPAADVIEVVRCKECEHWERQLGKRGICKSSQWENECLYYETIEHDFCSYGERKEQ